MIFKRPFLTCLVLCTALSACSLLPTPAPTAVPSDAAPVELVQFTATPTVDWFPKTPTTTPAPYVTHTATPEMRPGLGQTTLEDSFEDEKLWDTAVSDKGSASVDRNRLTLAVQPEVYMISLRHKLNLSDFYAEITARTNLCRGADDYGVLVRASAAAYYRFGLSCTGTVRADRISVGMRQVLQDALPSGDAPRGSPGEVRIGIWAVGSEMRLFLNGRYQFSVRNSNYRNGTIGVYARSAGDTPVTISFLDLVVQSVDYAPPTRTPSP